MDSPKLQKIIKKLLECSYQTATADEKGVNTFQSAVKMRF